MAFHVPHAPSLLQFRAITSRTDVALESSSSYEAVRAGGEGVGGVEGVEARRLAGVRREVEGVDGKFEVK